MRLCYLSLGVFQLVFSPRMLIFSQNRLFFLLSSFFSFNCLLIFCFIFALRFNFKNLLLVSGIAFSCWCRPFWRRQPSTGFRRQEKMKFSRFIHVLDLVLKCCSEINERHWIKFLVDFVGLLHIIKSCI